MRSGRRTRELLRALAVGALCATGLTTGANAGSGCPTDLVPNGVTDVDDLVAVILDWGCTGDDCAGDVAGVSPGIVDVDDLLATILGWGPCPLDDNDTCAGAIFMSPGDTQVGETLTATADPEALPCGTAVQSEGVWYACTGTGNTMTATLCEGTDYDTIVFVYCAGDDLLDPCIDMGCLGSNDQSIICNDQGGSFDQSRFSWCSEAGRSYLIYVSGWSGDNGNFTLTLEDDGTPCMDAVACTYPPPNDDCADAIALAPGESDTRITELAAADDEALPCGDRTPQGPGVWYSVTGTGNTMTVDLCQTDFNNQLYVYCAGDPEDPCAALSCIDSDDFGCGGNGASFSWCTAPGQSYLVYVCGWNGQTGEYTITVSDDAVPCVDALECTPVVLNDNCLDAIDVFPGVTPFSTIGATSGGPLVCSFPTRDIWYRHTVECAGAGGLLTISTCPTDGASINVFDLSGSLGGTCGDLSSNLIACDQDGICDSLQIPVFDGQELLIRLGGWTNQGDDLGIGELTIECADVGDDICVFADEVDLSGGFAEVQIDNCGATIDALAPLCGASNPPEIPGRWIELVGTGEEVTVSLCNGSNPSYDEGNPATWLDTRMLVYCGASAGEPCGLLKCAAPEELDNNDACPLTETVTFCTDPGRSYFVLVMGAGDFGSGCEGLVDVTFATGAACDDPPCPVFPSADFIEDAFDITEFIDGDPVFGTTIGATPPPHDADGSQRDPQLPLGSPSCSWIGNPDLCYGTVWYTFTAPPNGSLTAQTCNSEQARDTVMMLFSGTPGSLTEVFCAEDECNPWFRTILTATGLTPGEVYYLVVAHSAALDSAPGEFQLDLTSP